MRRIGIPLSIFVVMLLGLGALGSISSAGAEEATPAAMSARCPSPLATPIASPPASPAASSMATPSTEPVCVGVIEDDFYVQPERTTF